MAVELQGASAGDWDVPQVSQRQAQTKVERGGNHFEVRLQHLARAHQERREKRAGVHAALEQDQAMSVSAERVADGLGQVSVSPVLGVVVSAESSTRLLGHSRTLEGNSIQERECFLMSASFQRASFSLLLDLCISQRVLIQGSLYVWLQVILFRNYCGKTT